VPEETVEIIEETPAVDDGSSSDVSPPTESLQVSPYKTCPACGWDGCLVDAKFCGKCQCDLRVNPADNGVHGVVEPTPAASTLAPVVARVINEETAAPMAGEVGSDVDALHERDSAAQASAEEEHSSSADDVYEASTQAPATPAIRWQGHWQATVSAAPGPYFMQMGRHPDFSNNAQSYRLDAGRRFIGRTFTTDSGAEEKPDVPCNEDRGVSRVHAYVIVNPDGTAVFRDLSRHGSKLAQDAETGYKPCSQGLEYPIKSGAVLALGLFTRIRLERCEEETV
jgi:hypothetical protein